MATDEVYEVEYVDDELDGMHEDGVLDDGTADDGTADDGDPADIAGGLFSRSLVQGTGSFLSSSFFHLGGLILLALWMSPLERQAPPPTMVVDITPPPEEELDVVELEKDLEAAEAVAMAVYGAVSLEGASGGGVAGLVGEPTIDQEIVAAASASPGDIAIDNPLDSLPPGRQIIQPTPQGALGDARAIVDNYDDAMDRITQEIVWMLSKSDVLLVWCFDQSGSMKDDQQEIRSRIRKVYSELGLRGVNGNEALTTGVTSYGQGFMIHTPTPTSNVGEIEQAIGSVPSDPSGKEMMCPAVTLSIGKHAPHTKGRQMMLVLVTDESGEQESNAVYLEQAIATAKNSRCRIYVLGREAVFGYPYAHMRWRHPQTHHTHWLPIDRGPETAFVEQLQTECFRKRTDAHPSGFGSYEQARMARETGGIFFMLPSLETDLVRGEKRRYELEAMRSYRVDLRDRATLVAERQASVLRSTLTKVISDLNPYRADVAKIMTVDFSFSAKPAQFVQQARREQLKARTYLNYLLTVERVMDEIRYHRQQETSARWKANYDLIYAQILQFIARTYEYGMYLEHFIAEPKVVPTEKPNFHRLSSWHIRETGSTLGGEQTTSYIQRSQEMFNKVIADHPGTPWAARAALDLKRGFGVELHPHYAYYGPRPNKPRTFSGPKIPIPKL